ncbi:MAG: TolC family protein [Isosphaeraceae bacterium]
MNKRGERHRGPRIVRLACVVVITLTSAPGTSRAQEAGRKWGGVLLEFPNFGPIPGSTEPTLGPGPGTLEPGAWGPESGLIGGRRRSARIPRAGKPQTVGPLGGASRRSLSLPEPLPSSAGFRSPALPSSSVEEDEGPSDGLTLDQAIEQLLRNNLDILALKYEIPQADADILTAGLRSNPLIYGDVQFIPYGSFTDQRPGGPTQYDLNLTFPVDLTHKRQSRVRVARAARNVLEAQFQDVIRRQIGQLARAFVELQSARLICRAAEASVRAQQRVLGEAPSKAETSEELAREHDHFTVLLERARSDLDEARDDLRDAQESLAALLNLPAEQVSSVQARGSLRDTAPPAPPLDQLVKIALDHRPDLVAGRRGITRAQAELGLQRANRLDDVYFFYDPITYQDNRPSRLPSSRSWIVAVAMPLPVFNRNQGNIARAHGNLHQTQMELASLERRVISEVRLAEREYRSSRATLDRFEKVILPHSHWLLQRTAREFAEGKLTVDDYLGHLEDEAEAARGQRDALVRHRRSMVDLNTALGVRLLP